jgi:hypothetical protein
LSITNLGSGEELLLLLPLEDGTDKVAGSLDGTSLQLSELGLLGSLALSKVFLVGLGVVLLLLGLLLSSGLLDGGGGLAGGGLGLSGLLVGVNGTLDLGYNGRIVIRSANRARPESAVCY